MKLLRYIAAAILILVVLVVTFDVCRLSSYRRNAALIKIGDSQDRVLSLLGQPTERCKISGGFLSRDWWGYGSHLPDFDWKRTFRPEFPWICPTIKLNLFAPDTNDVAVYFDGGGTVAAVYIPGR